jgi:ATP-dependent exoDNAse (exonuclease V) alpha subunit
MSITPTPAQAAVIEELLEWLSRRHSSVREMSLSGPAGTGKTTLMSVLSSRARTLDVRIIWTAMTGKAARRLAEFVPGARTLHSCLYWPPSERSRELKFEDVRPWDKLKMETGDVCVVDEASMVSPKLRQDIEGWIQDGARVLYVGDGYQLPPVMSRQEERDHGKNFTIFTEVPGPRLTEVIRNDDSILSIATRIREEKRLPHDNNEGFEFRLGSLNSAVDDWFNDPESHVLLTWRNNVRMAINDNIRRRQRRGADPESGEPVVFCKNNSVVRNGEVDTFVGIDERVKLGPIVMVLANFEDAGLVVSSIEGKDAFMDGKSPSMNGDEWDEYLKAMRKFRTKYEAERRGYLDTRISPITWAYCLTAHKAQGSEYRRVTIALPSADTGNYVMRQPTLLPDGTTTPFAMRWLYTAVTRAKSRCTVVVGD